MTRSGQTPPFRGPHGEPAPDSIAEAGYFRLGGVDQWVLIRGARITNPPLVVLHGGPGFSDTPFFRRFNQPLESSFTMVYWDQRGTGKSFHRDLARSSMTVEQFVADLGELVGIVCKRVGQDRVVLFGHSWGSVLGVLYASRCPDKVAAYVGSGQYGDCLAAEAASYAFALAEADRRNNRRAVSDLHAIGPPPYDARSVMKVRTWIQRFDGQLGAKALWNLGRLLVSGPEYSMLDLPGTIRGFRFSLEAMWTEVSRLNLATLAPALQVPVFFLLGRRDHWVPPETSAAYFDRLTAPSKTLVWFDESGHEPFVDEAARFNAAIVQLVRPTV